jgi:periplasmic divalent cation tolerance protein
MSEWHQDSIQHMGALVVITTVPDENLAVKMAETFVVNRLAACVHRLPSGTSVYRWQGTIETATEITLMIKTSIERYAELEAAICQMHVYDVPGIIAFPATAGLPAYLNWIVDETTTL